MATPNIASYCTPLHTNKSYSLQYHARIFYITVGSVTYSELTSDSAVSKGSYKIPFSSKTNEFNMSMKVTGDNVGTISVNGSKPQACTFSESGGKLTISSDGHTITITKSSSGPVMVYEGNKLRIKS